MQVACIIPGFKESERGLPLPLSIRLGRRFIVAPSPPLRLTNLTWEGKESRAIVISLPSRERVKEGTSQHNGPLRTAARPWPKRKGEWGDLSNASFGRRQRGE